MLLTESFFRFGETFTVVIFTYVEPQKVKPLLDVGNHGFLCGEFQSSIGKKFADERFNLLFEVFAVATSNHKIVRIADEVYFEWVTVWFVMSVEVYSSFQSIKYHIGNDWRNDTTLCTVYCYA